MQTRVATSATAYAHLEPRPGSFYRELFIAGLNLRASRLVEWMEAQGLTAEQAAADRDLPVQAVLEATHYVKTHRNLLLAERRRERARRRERGLLAR